MTAASTSAYSSQVCPVSRYEESTPSRSAIHASVCGVGRVLPRSIWLTYSLEKRSPARSDCVRPAATRSCRNRVPRPDETRCGATEVRVRPSMVRHVRYRPLVQPLGSLARVTRSRDGLRSSGLVQLCVDRARRLGRHARDALELLLRRGEETLGRAEVLQQRAAPHRADALELVEDRRERAGVAPPSVTTRLGVAAKDSSYSSAVASDSRAKRRETISAIAAKSSIPSCPRTPNLR